MKYFYCIFLFCISSSLFAQVNLVPNPSFEDYTQCPNSAGDINFANNWIAIADSPDYFNLCSMNGFGVPDNFLGSQLASNGIAYAGFIACGPLSGINAREYLGITLTQSLTIGQKYFVSFKVVLSDPRGQHNCACNNLGIRFTTFSVFQVSPATLYMNNSPQIFSSAIIDDSLNWTVINGSFIADSSYTNLIVGNFFDDMHTDTLHCPTGGAYYFVDEICVSTDSTFCSFSSNIQIIDNPDVEIHSNLDNSNLTFYTKNNFVAKLFLYNSVGILITEITNDKSEQSLEMSTAKISNGVYYAAILLTNNIRITKRIIIQHF